MHLSTIYLSNFRAYKKVSLKLNRKLNIFIGENGAGKTNLLEAFYFLARQKSFRKAGLPQLLHDGAESFSLTLYFERGKEKHTLNLGYTRLAEAQGWRKRLLLNKRPPQREEKLFNFIKVLLFTQDDVQLVHGSPSLRRNFFNASLSLEAPSYKESLAEYQKLLSQRNKQLRLLRYKKMQRESLTSLTPLTRWDAPLALQAARVTALRFAFIKAIAQRFAHYFSELAQKKDCPARLAYSYSLAGQSFLLDPLQEKERGRYKIIQKTRGALNSENMALDAKFYLASLKAAEKKDLRFGHSCVGPHTEDFVFLVNGQNAQHRLSQGETRALVNALKLSMHWLTVKREGIRPLLLLDDVFADLDQAKIRALLKALMDSGQAIIACANEELLTAAYSKLSQENKTEQNTIFFMKKGSLELTRAESNS